MHTAKSYSPYLFLFLFFLLFYPSSSSLAWSSWTQIDLLNEFPQNGTLVDELLYAIVDPEDNDSSPEVKKWYVRKEAADYLAACLKFVSGPILSDRNNTATLNGKFHFTRGSSSYTTTTTTTTTSSSSSSSSFFFFSFILCVYVCESVYICVFLYIYMCRWC